MFPHPEKMSGSAPEYFSDLGRVVPLVYSLVGSAEGQEFLSALAEREAPHKFL